MTKNNTNTEIAKKLYAFEADLGMEIHAKSERGLVLVLVSGLDYIIGEVLTQFFVDSGTLSNALFDASGPLSTFSGKIKLSAALGLISDDEMRHLDKYRSIRNKFAHDFGISLSDTSLADQCKDLHEKLLPDEELPSNPLSQFHAAGVSLFSKLLQRYLNARQQKRQPAQSQPAKPIGTRPQHGL